MTRLKAKSYRTPNLEEKENDVGRARTWSIIHVLDRRITSVTVYQVLLKTAPARSATYSSRKSFPRSECEFPNSAEVPDPNASNPSSLRSWVCGFSLRKREKVHSSGENSNYPGDVRPAHRLVALHASAFAHHPQARIYCYSKIENDPPTIPVQHLWSE